MTDKELNEKIARLIGWRSGIHGGHEYWQPPPFRFGVVDSLPNYLARERLHELLDLACKVMPHWDLSYVDVGAFEAAPDFAESRDTYPAPRDGKLRTGKTASRAIALAIVAFEESSHEATLNSTRKSPG